MNQCTTTMTDNEAVFIGRQLQLPHFMRVKTDDYASWNQIHTSKTQSFISAGSVKELRELRLSCE